jgi:hypothetical protein
MASSVLLVELAAVGSRGSCWSWCRCLVPGLLQFGFAELHEAVYRFPLL